MSEASQTNYPQGVPNAKKLLCGIDLRIGEYLTDQSPAIESVCQALNRPRVRLDANGYEEEIVGGTVSDDGQRVAWVECRSKELKQNHVDVDFHLRARIDGQAVIDWEVETYNPYFGCHVQYMRWWGDRVVLIYHEKHKTIVGSVAGPNDVKLIPISVRWDILDDTVLFESEEPDLIEALGLPDLEPRLPMPLQLLKAVQRSDWRLVMPSSERNRLPQDPERLWNRLQHRLFGQNHPQPLADLLIGSLAYPFWNRWPQPTDKYPRNCRRWNSPHWLAFYWSLSLTDHERQALLGEMDRLALTPLCGMQAEWDAETCATELATTYIVQSASELATACRAGLMPEMASCYFWVDWSLAEFEADLELFPRGLREVFKRLIGQKPRWHELGEQQGKRSWEAKLRQWQGQVTQ